MVEIDETGRAVVEVEVGSLTLELFELETDENEEENDETGRVVVEVEV